MGLPLHRFSREMLLCHFFVGAEVPALRAFGAVEHLGQSQETLFQFPGLLVE